jgi:hypothetical protein
MESELEDSLKLGLYCHKDEDNVTHWYLSTLTFPVTKIWLDQEQSLDMIAEACLQHVLKEENNNA